MTLIPNEMHAVEVTTPGGPEVLQPVQVAVPECGAEEVLIRVLAAGVNRPDCLQRAGLYPLPPDASPLPGLEVAGEVVAVGADVTRWQPGARVCALTHGGGYAEYCVANAGHCLPWPQGLSAAEAATLPETCFTVQHNMLERGRLRRGEAVLIHGGSSGIGTTAIQIAKAVGATVFATAGSAEKCDYCRQQGADFAINYRAEDFVDVVRDKTAGKGVDVVLDMVAGSYVMRNIRALGADGRYVMIAFLEGAVAEVNFGHFIPRRLTLTGSTLRPQSVAAKTRIADAVADSVWPLVHAGQVRSHIHASFALNDAAKAHQLMESSAHMGKLVLSINENQ